MRPTATPHIRPLSFLLVLALALALIGVTGAGAFGSTKREAKKIKGALLRIEHRLDLAIEEQRDLRALSDERRTRLTTMQGALPVEASRSDALSSFDVVASVIEFTGLHLDQLASRARLDELKTEINSLTSMRHEKVAELQGLVRSVQKAKPTSALIVGGSIVTYSADWEAVAQCESSGDWHIDAKFDGGLQFLPATWIGFGGGELARYAYQATKTEQIAVAERVLAIQGQKAWPNCFHPLPFAF
ncbi:MAG: transglycosylase family protein [Actinomycetota bacterium]